MSHQILIVDDDTDFASLLADVFTQADYGVEVTGDPVRAEDLVRAQGFDLVVTDLRMPRIDGIELAQRIRAVHPGMPVIIVSGYLDTDTRQRMEREQIVALYEKPLSVFSLLKTAASVIEEASRKEGRSRGGASRGTGEQEGLAFPFTALPAVSAASRAFAEKLYNQRSKKASLAVIGAPGVPFHAIAEDYVSWLGGEHQAGRILEASDTSLSRIQDAIRAAADAGVSVLQIVLIGTESLDAAQQKLVQQATRRGAFDEIWSGSIRFVFMLEGELDELYAEGLIGDSLYLAIGTSEVRIPRLNDCPEDIEAIVDRFTEENLDGAEWEDDARAALLENEWVGNHAQLRSTLLQVQRNLEGRVISRPIVLHALKEEQGGSLDTHGASQISLKHRLADSRNAFLRACHLLAGGDIALAAEAAGTTAGMVKARVGD